MPERQKGLCRCHTALYEMVGPYRCIAHGIENMLTHKVLRVSWSTVALILRRSTTITRPASHVYSPMYRVRSRQRASRYSNKSGGAGRTSNTRSKSTSGNTSPSSVSTPSAFAVSRRRACREKGVAPCVKHASTSRRTPSACINKEGKVEERR